jgi:protein PhnA
VYTAETMEDIEEADPTLDAHGSELADGDSVIIIKDLKVKGAGATLKKGTKVKNIRLTETPKEIEGQAENIRGLVLRTEFVKKA